MTILKNPVTRKTSCKYRTLGNRQLVVTLHPSEFGDYILIKELYSHTPVRINLDTIYYAAVQAEVDKKKAEKAKARKLKRKARK